ncbi:hypothetical protein B4589_009050 [Halolamina sp. CBA1230]|uniref:hypothetical protein n=1 Tax=Halolamina sp. CBA1230 TaxID=1853690 RepID=UPI0009A22853|nr:hypothetical protein [Halolamina sp. CBA1230]QKY20517.1 hypothetical protein B4589_009050 [Halolamina sp. CBA1230]
MTTTPTPIDRRTALRTLAVSAVVGVGGCLAEDGQQSDPGTGSETDTDGTSDGPFQAVGVDGTTLVVELAAETAVAQVNLITPNGELWGTRDVAAGAEQVSFAFRGAYPPGEYDVVGVDGEETVGATSLEIRPELEIQEVGLYRNHPDKPWEEVYGESETNRLINGEAFVTVENTGTGPETVTELVFSGDVPAPTENPRSNGLQRTDRALIPAGRRVDLYSSSFPFGSKAPDGMGCSTDGNSGQFTVVLETLVNPDSVKQTFDVRYESSSDMTDCEVTIMEA